MGCIVITNNNHARLRLTNWKDRRNDAVDYDEAASGDFSPFVELYDLSTFTDADGAEWCPWVHAKCLNHHMTTMFADKLEVDRLLEFLRRPTTNSLSRLPRHPSAVRQHEDPAGYLGVEPSGMDHQSIRIPEYIDARSPQGFAEIMEVHAMACLRDVDFNAYSSDPNALAVIASLNAIALDIPATNWPKQGGMVTPKTLFRGRGRDELEGPYVSQFFLVDVAFGNATCVQQFAHEGDIAATSTDIGFWEMQIGRTNLPPNTIPGSRAHLSTARGLGSVVHNDPVYGCYFVAALEALKAGHDGFDTTGLPFTDFLDTNKHDLLSQLGAVARGALRVAWGNKWKVGLKIRPEVYGARMQVADGMTAAEAAQVPGFTDLKARMAMASVQPILNMVRAKNAALTGSNGLWLTQMFPEGSPTHPSFPAGHAALAGAVVTVMKAYLKTHDSNGVKVRFLDVWDAVYEGSPTGLVQVQASDDPTIANMTVVGELNKMASNVALGRNMGGVHYRSDGDCGLEAGEEFAISVLRTQCQFWYPLVLEPISFNLEKFDGTFITISANDDP